MRVTVTETHLDLIDRVVTQGGYGNSRNEVLCATAKEHVRHLLSGGGHYDAGGQSLIDVTKPEYGSKRYDIVLQPVSGKAIPVHTGETLRIVQVEGGQCVDFNAYNLHDYKEYLDCGFNRLKGLSTGKGTIVWTGSPRARPMYIILDHSEPFHQWYSGHRCNAIMYDMELGQPFEHPNCQDTFAESIREYGLTPDDVHDSYNFWMHNTFDSQGRRQFYWNDAQKDDFVDILALFDTLAVPIICGDDITPLNSYEPSPIQVQVFEASAGTLELVNLVQERYGRYKHQRTPQDFKLKDIRAERELRPDPNYQPDFVPALRKDAVDVEVSAELRGDLQALMKTGIYGRSEEKALLACFVRWYELNGIKDRYKKLSIH